MVGHRRRGRGGTGGVGVVGTRDRHELLLADEAVEQLGVVDHLVAAADLGVLVLDRVEAVRAGHHDLGRLDLVEHLDVALGEHLEEQLVAGAAGRVAGARLAVTEDGEADPGGVEQLGHGAGRLLRPVLVGAGAADPEQVVDLGGVLHVLAHDLDLERQVLGPVEAGPGRHAPGVGLVLEVLEQAAELGGEGRLDQHLVAAQVHDRVDVLDVDGALLDAGAARRTRPQDVLVDHRVRPVRVVGPQRVRDVVARVADQRQLGQGPGLLGQAVTVGLGRQQVRRLGVRVVAHRHHQHLGRQRLLGVPGGALRLAAAALGAGGEVQQALPGEVLDLAGAERGVLVEVLDVLEVHRGATDRDRLQRAQRRAAVGVPLEVDVEEGEEPVPGHAHRRLQRDGDQPGHRDEDLQRGDDDDGGLEGADRQAGERGADEERQREVQRPAVALAGRPGQGVLQATQGQDAQDDAEDGQLDVVGLPERRPVEPAAALQGARVLPLADGHQHEDAHQRRPRDELGDPLVGHEVADQREREAGGEQLAVRREQGEEQQPEGDHHEPVRRRHDRQPRHPGVAEELAHQRAGAGDRVAGAVRVGLAEPEHRQEVAHHLGEERDRDRGDGEADDERDDLQGWHAREFTDR